MSTTENISLCIKYNNCATNDPCAICGDRTDPDVGPEVFVEGTAALVCRSCTLEHDPVLAAILAAIPADFDPWSDQYDLAQSTLPVVRIRFSSDPLNCEAPAELRHRDCPGFVPNHGQLIPALIDAGYHPLCDQCAERVSTATEAERGRLMAPDGCGCQTRHCEHEAEAPPPRTHRLTLV